MHPVLHLSKSGSFYPLSFCIFDIWHLSLQGTLSFSLRTVIWKQNKTKILTWLYLTMVLYLFFPQQLSCLINRERKKKVYTSVSVVVVLNFKISNTLSPKVFNNKWGFPSGSVVSKYTPANAGDAGLILGSRRGPWGRNGNTLQSSCLENPTDRGA